MKLFVSEAEPFFVKSTLPEVLEFGMMSWHPPQLWFVQSSVSAVTSVETKCTDQAQHLVTSHPASNNQFYLIPSSKTFPHYSHRWTLIRKWEGTGDIGVKQTTTNPAQQGKNPASTVALGEFATASQALHESFPKFTLLVLATNLLVGNLI